MTISASMVKDLRERTGAGMMDCKKALEETSGDFEAAIEWLRKKGIAKAAKKSGRTAAEGIVAAVAEGNKGAVVEVNSETDFVSRNEAFVDYVNTLAHLVLTTGTTEVEALKNAPWPKGGTVGEALTTLVATIGENMSIRRAATLSVASGVVSSYVHMNGKIGVLVALESAKASDILAQTARNVAMHVAAANPTFLNPSMVDNTSLEKEKEIFAEQARLSGKPEAIIAKIVEGRINKYYEEVCLTEQPFIMDTDQKVAGVVKAADSSAKVSGYVRFQLGEGIEKEASDFAEEVAAVAGMR